ncbi:MAG: hypothetical protein EHM59_18400, partial [Betaproteobacteria bacterium]
SEALRIRVSPQALAQIEEAADRWATNRPAAPGAIRQDLARFLPAGTRVAAERHAFKCNDAEQCVPYQTLIASVLHKYVTGRLTRL